MSILAVTYWRVTKIILLKLSYSDTVIVQYSYIMPKGDTRTKARKFLADLGKRIENGRRARAPPVNFNAMKRAKGVKAPARAKVATRKPPTRKPPARANVATRKPPARAKVATRKPPARAKVATRKPPTRAKVATRKPPARAKVATRVNVKPYRAAHPGLNGKHTVHDQRMVADLINKHMNK